MSEIQTFYPTSGMSERSYYTVIQALYNCVNGIPEITNFFDSVEKIGDETKTSYSDFAVKFKKGNSYLQIKFSSNAMPLKIYNKGNSYYSESTRTAESIDIPVRFIKGVNNTRALWLDEYNKGVVMVFNKYGDKYFLANSESSNNYSFDYSDTGGNVSTLTNPLNGDNIGTASEYIAQPYYHLGINTGDIYTFDGGGYYIPWGKFKLADNEFVRLTSNFALKIN